MGQECGNRFKKRKRALRGPRRRASGPPGPPLGLGLQEVRYSFGFVLRSPVTRSPSFHWVRLRRISTRSNRFRTLGLAPRVDEVNGRLLCRDIDFRNGCPRPGRYQSGGGLVTCQGLRATEYSAWITVPRTPACPPRPPEPGTPHSNSPAENTRATPSVPRPRMRRSMNAVPRSAQADPRRPDRVVRPRRNHQLAPDLSCFRRFLEDFRIKPVVGVGRQSHHPQFANRPLLHFPRDAARKVRDQIRGRIEHPQRLFGEADSYEASPPLQREATPPPEPSRGPGPPGTS